MRRVSTKLGELDCQVVNALAPGSTPELAVILCHGYGAPATDLVPLAAELMTLRPELARHTRFVFPGAPLPLLELGMPGSRAWFPIPTELFTGRVDWDKYSREEPEGLRAARRAVMSTVSAVAAATNLPFRRIVLGGFSQGSWVTTDVALRLEEPPAACASSRARSSSGTSGRPGRRLARGCPSSRPTGATDDLLPIQTAERLRDLLIEAGLDVEFLPFDGPHTLMPEELERLADFLVKRLESR